MGSNCMRPTNTSIPIRVVRVSQKTIASASLTKTRSNSKDEETERSHLIVISKSQNQGEQQESPNTDDLKTSVTPVKVFENDRLTESIYNTKHLNIGEHYLSDNKVVSENSGSAQKTPLKKKKNPTARSAKIDEIVDKVKETLGQMKINELTRNLQNGTDICLRQYSKDQPQKFNKLYYEGLSMKHRWNFWKARLYPDKYFVEGLYERFLALHSKSTKDIQKDVHRTFPEETYFSAEYEKIGQNQLYNVLKALSLYFPNLGYCQGMNFIVGFLLLINGGDELEAFWMFVALARNTDFLMMGFFEKNFPLLDLYIYVFYELLNREMPQLCLHMKSLAMPDSMWITKWILTVFLYSLPANKVVRIWDYIISEELFSVLKVAVGLLKMYEKELLKSDIMGVNDLFRFLQTEKAIRDPKVNQDESSFIFSAKEIEIDVLIKTAKKISLTKMQISQYCKQFIEKSAKQPGHEYYKFYSDYETNSKNETSLAEFQRETDWKIVALHLTDEPKASPKIEPAIKEPVESMILKDLEIEDVENSSIARKSHLQKVQEEGELNGEGDNELEEEAKDGVPDLSSNKKAENTEEGDHGQKSPFDSNPLTHFALKEQGNFEAKSWIEQTPQRNSQLSSMSKGDFSEIQTGIDEAKADERGQDSVKASISKEQTIQGRVLSKKPSNNSILHDRTHRSSKGGSIQDFSQKIAGGL